LDAFERFLALGKEKASGNIKNLFAARCVVRSGNVVDRKRFLTPFLSPYLSQVGEGFRERLDSQGSDIFESFLDAFERFLALGKETASGNIKNLFAARCVARSGNVVDRNRFLTPFLSGHGIHG
jgi:hypothetical protein